MRIDFETLLPVAIAITCACTLEPTGANEDDFGSAGATPSTTAPSADDTGEPPAAESSSTDAPDAPDDGLPPGETTDDGSDTDGSVLTSGGDTGGGLPPTGGGGLPTGGAAQGCYGHADRASCEADGCEWTSLGSGTELCADPGVLGTGGLDDLCEGLTEVTCELIGCVWDGSACTASGDAASTGGEEGTTGGASG